MYFISHRGNTVGVNEERENTVKYIEHAIDLEYHVEIDLREHNGSYYLGHDEPQYLVDPLWLFLNRKNLWIHAKDINSLVFCQEAEALRFFFHESERHTLISNNLIWTHDLSEPTHLSIIPLISSKLSQEEMQKYTNISGICSDFIDHYRSMKSWRC